MLEIKHELRDVRQLNGSELEHYCQRGWQLICVLQEKTVGTVRVPMPCPGPPQDRSGPCPHGTWAPSTCYETESREVAGESTRTIYVVGRNPESTVGELGLRVEELEQRASQLSMELQSARHEKEKAMKAAEASGAQLATEQANSERLDRLYKEERANTRTAEKEVANLKAQIQRLSAEFGDREVRRVLS